MKLLIIGASGHGKVALDVALKMKVFTSIEFLDNTKTGSLLGYPIKGITNDYKNYITSHVFFVAIGNNQSRKKVIEELLSNNATITTLVHPTSVIGIDVSIGSGSILMANTVINTSSTIGKGCIINTKVSIDHDCMIKDYVHLSPNVTLSGTVCIDENTWLGTSSTVINNISICRNVLVGASTLVHKDIINEGTYVGVPMRKWK